MSSNFFDIRGKNLLESCPTGVDPIRWSEFRCAMGKASQYEEKDDGPIQIDLELNGTCNMKCPFCIHGYGEQTNLNKNISIDQAKAILDQARNAGAYSLKLNYINEPLLRNDLEEVAMYAKEIGFVNIYLVTNGSLLTDERRASILSCGLTRIYVSIDAATSDTYNKQRRNGMYDTVVNSVTELIALRNKNGAVFPLIRVSFLKNSANIHEALDFFDQWKDKADMIAFQAMNEVPSHSTGLAIESFKNPAPCDFPFKQLVIDHEGNILPCCKLPGRDLRVGNIDTMTIREAWQSSKMKDLRAMHKEGRWVESNTCRACLTNG
jgi:radical SAM protein with 4Fe4S-binding SPASM domain